MALFDQTLDEAVSVNDSSVVAASYDIELFDFVAITPGFATVYDFTFLDSLGTLDSAFVSNDPHRITNDNVTVKDAVSPQMTLAALVDDLVGVSDKTYAGLEKVVATPDTVEVSDFVLVGRDRYLEVNDAVAYTDHSTTGVELNTALSDIPLSVNDLVFPWINGTLALAIEGTASASATLLQRGTPSITLVSVPPRTTALPKPPLEQFYHNVLTSPVHRRE